MKDRNRLNLIMGVLYPLETLVANFFVKQAVRYQLGTDFLGLQNVYTNFCDILTFAFAGLGIAMMFRLYRPIEEGDELLVNKLFHYFEKVFRYFTFGAAAAGLVLTGLVVWSVNTDNIQVPEVISGYILYLVSSLIYNRFYIYYFYLSAWQKRYAACLIHSVTDLGALSVEIGCLLVFRNYTIFLCSIILKNIVEAVVIYTYTNRNYPYLKDKKVSTEGPETKGAFADVKHMVIAKIGNLLVGSTDSILISGLVSTFAAGCYSSYYFLYLGLTTVTSSFYESIMNRVGKQLVTRTRDSQFRHFVKISVLNIAIAAVVVNGFFRLSDDFINLWMGPELILGKDIVILVSINLFMVISRHSVSIYRQSAGLFDKASRMILAWGVLNLVLSVILGHFFGMFGILIATSISDFVTIYWYEPYIIYRFFGRSFGYAFLYEIIALAGVISTILVTGPVVDLIAADSWLMLIVKTIVLMGISFVWLFVILGIPGYIYGKRHPERPDTEPEQKDRISVIVSVYNVAPYLHDCLDSILAQSYRNLEIILVDDGSDDGGSVICDEYAEKDSRINVIHQENRGLSAARNAGSMAASGKYLSFVDGDDILHPDYFSYLYNMVINTRADVSVVDYRVFEDRERFMKQTVSWNEPVSLSGKDAVIRIIKDHEPKMITSWGKLYDVKQKENLRYPEGRIHEDEFTTYKVFYEAGKVAVGDMKLYGLRKRDGSITSVYNENRLHKLDALEECVNWMENRNEEEMSDLARIRYILNLEITWYNVHTKMKDAGQLEESLVIKHKEQIGSCWKEVKHLAAISERLSVMIFSWSPGLYRLFAGAYLLIGKERG